MPEEDHCFNRTPAVLLLLAAACGQGSGEQDTMPAFPQVSINDGVVLRDVTVVTIVTEGDPVAADLFAFGDAAAASQWWQTAAAELDLGGPPRSLHRTGGAISTDVAASDISKYVERLIADQGPEPDGHTIYLLYLPPGINYIDAVSAKPNVDCEGLSGFHQALGKKGDAWAFVQRCPPPGGESQVEHLSLIASAQVLDAATNPTGRGYTLGPVPVPLPWTLSIWHSYEQRGYVELADLCKGSRIVEGGHLYARYWSNAATARPGTDPCAPGVAWPYYNVQVPREWYTIAPGEQLTIPLVGWTNEARPDWRVTGAVKHSTEAGWTATVTGEKMLGDGAVVNDGRTGQLVVSPSAMAGPGSYAVVLLRSEDMTPTGLPEAGRDRFHARPVGIYVAP